MIFLFVTFTNNLLTNQNRQIGRVVAIGKRDGGLYVLERVNSAFILSLEKNLFVLHMICHVNHSLIIFFLNKERSSFSYVFIAFSITM